MWGPPRGRASIMPFIAYAGGLSRVEGSFASSTPSKSHQGDLRLTNSTLAENANGRGGQAELTREGRGRNGEGAIYIRGGPADHRRQRHQATEGYYSGAINIERQ